MWLEFIIAATTIALLLFVPGYFLTRCFGVPRCHSLCFAPIISISLLCIIGQIATSAGVAVWQIALAGILCIVPVVAFLCLRKNIASMPMLQISWWLPLVFVGIGCALGVYLFVSVLPSSDAMFQAYDITKHLNLIQAISDSGHFSSLGTDLYLAPADQAINPYPGSGFYPAAWHILCALVITLTGVSALTVINASMFVFCFLVFPLATLAFLNTIFSGRKKIILCGSVVCLAFVAFPWDLLMFGPIYPNVAGFATLPATMALCVLLFQAVADRLKETGTKQETEGKPSCKLSFIFKLITLIVLAVIGQALLHPNTIFSCFALLVALFITQAWSVCRSRGLANVASGGICIGIAVLFALLWFACFKLPFLSDTVSHVWPPYAGRKLQAIVGILTQTYTMHFFAEIASQIALGILVVIGFVRALHTPKVRWLAYSYAIICFIHIENAVRDDYFKQIIAGFWYTDPMRIASVAVIAAIPLAALGLAWVCDTALLVVKKYNVAQHKTTHPAKTYAAVICLFLIMNFMPSFDVPGNHMDVAKNQPQAEKKDMDPVSNQHTTFGDYKDVATVTFSYDKPFSYQERLFAREAADLIPEGSLVINNPMDGSFLAYGTSGMRTYYRDFSNFDSDTETSQSKIIRKELNDIESNSQVKKAVDEIGARYVMILDQSDSDTSFINLRKSFHPEEFGGITSITEETPGFNCIYEKDGMKLYEINA